MKIEELTEYEKGILMNRGFTIGIVKDKETDYSKPLIKNCGFDKEPIMKFKSLPIGKLSKHKTIEHGGKGDCLVGETVYDSHLIAEVLRLIGKRNVELYQKEEDYPLGIKVEDKLACVAPVILVDNEDKIYLLLYL